MHNYWYAALLTNIYREEYIEFCPLLNELSQWFIKHIAMHHKRQDHSLTVNHNKSRSCVSTLLYLSRILLPSKRQIESQPLALVAGTSKDLLTIGPPSCHSLLKDTQLFSALSSKWLACQAIMVRIKNYLQSTFLGSPWPVLWYKIYILDHFNRQVT